MRDRIILIVSAVVILTSLVCVGYEMTADNTVYAKDTEDVVWKYDTIGQLPDQLEIPWLLELDLRNEIVTIYAIDDEGKYTTVINQFPCSGGLKAHKTESKTPYMFLELYVGVGQEEKSSYMRLRDWGEWGWVEYLTNIYGKFLFHSILYEDRSCTTYVYNAYEDITFPASHGCVRLLTQDVKWIYDSLEQGVLCNVTKNDANPELTQMYQPPPPKDGEVAATNPPNPYVRTTSEPNIPWEILNDDPKDYVPGNFG